MDPSALLVLAVFSSRFAPRLGAAGLAGRLAAAADAPTPLGKLRVRLSTLAAGRPLTAALPLLGERRRGLRAAATATLTLRLDFGSTAARLKAAAAPPLPKEAYYHKLATDSVQSALAAQRRRLVLRWLAGASPPVPRAAAMYVLGSTGEDFFVARFSTNWRRMRAALYALSAAFRNLDRIQSWKSWPLSLTANAAVIGVCYFARAAVPLLLLRAALGCWRNRGDGPTGLPPPMEEDPEAAGSDSDAAKELDAAVPHFMILRRKYRALKRVTIRVQGITETLAAQMERGAAACAWDDPLTTGTILATLVVTAVLIALLGPRHVVCFGALFVIRHPRLRTPTPPPPAALFARLPTHGDRIA
jgi:hypothetical protein